MRVCIAAVVAVVGGGGCRRRLLRHRHPSRRWWWRWWLWRREAFPSRTRHRPSPHFRCLHRAALARPPHTHALVAVVGVLTVVLAVGLAGAVAHPFRHHRRRVHSSLCTRHRPSPHFRCLHRAALARPPHTHALVAVVGVLTVVLAVVLAVAVAQHFRHHRRRVHSSLCTRHRPSPHFRSLPRAALARPPHTHALVAVVGVLTVVLAVVLAVAVAQHFRHHRRRVHSSLCTRHRPSPHFRCLHRAALARPPHTHALVAVVGVLTVVLAVVLAVAVAQHFRHHRRRVHSSLCTRH